MVTCTSQSPRKADGCKDAAARTLDAHSPRLCQSTRMIIRQATTFRIMMLSSLPTIPPSLKGDEDEGPAATLHASITLHLDPVLKQKNHIISNNSLFSEHAMPLVPGLHSNHRASAVGCNDRTEFTFNMNATYRPGNDPTDSNVTISKSLHFDSISHTAQNAFLPQMMHIQSRFSADSLLVASQPDQPTACTAMTEPSCADLEAGTFIHQRVREDQNRRNM
ncbi:hypothetical protein BLNAU_25279 [Blattamonas nauphoetae]|uniref:Uncharacterized protein n=1 Tax=Blattamonas nauphoetae TaxID=2049346 RepID=A0ABQ9WK20_9EUKA|nr:hypothetical protein BLNAU_25279 [Blattamonas nauphoetae]